MVSISHIPAPSIAQKAKHTSGEAQTHKCSPAARQCLPACLRHFRTVSSLVRGFAALLGFKRGLIPSFLFLFSVKSDTVKVPLSAVKNHQQRNENRVELWLCLIPASTRDAAKWLQCWKDVWCERVSSVFRCQACSITQEEIIVHGEGACVGSRYLHTLLPSPSPSSLCRGHKQAL